MLRLRVSIHGSWSPLFYCLRSKASTDLNGSAVDVCLGRHPALPGRLNLLDQQAAAACGNHESLPLAESYHLAWLPVTGRIDRWNSLPYL